MRIPASNKQTVNRRYSYRQRSDEIFLPTMEGNSSSSVAVAVVVKEQRTMKSVTAADDEQDTSNLRASHSVDVALNKQLRAAKDNSVTATANLVGPKVHDVNQVENQENHYIAANINQAHRKNNGGNLTDASSSSLQHKSGSLAERRLQQRSAIFKKGELENQPSVVNTVLTKKRLGVDSGGGDDASVMMLTEIHRVGPHKAIDLTEKSARTSFPNGRTSGGATDFATKLAWAAKLEKRRDAFTKKIPSSPTANHHRRQGLENKDSITSNVCGDNRDENMEVCGGEVKVEEVSEKNAVSGGNAVDEQVYPSPSQLDFSNTKAWAAELAKQKVLSDKKKVLDNSDTLPCNMSSLDITDNNNCDDDHKTVSTTKTTTDKDEKDEFSARLRAKRRQLSEKKRKTNDDIVASTDKAEDSVWYDFDIPTLEKHQSMSLSYSGTMDDQSVLHPNNSEDAKGVEEMKIPTDSNPLAPILLLQEKRILSLEKKRQSYSGVVCEEQEYSPSNLADHANPMMQRTEEFLKTSISREIKEGNHSTSLVDKMPVSDLFHDLHEMEQTSQVHDTSNKNCQVPQGDATSVLSGGNSESYVKNSESIEVPSKSELHQSLTSKQQIAFTKIIAEYETKLECKSSEIEYLKSEISNQHVQILELLRQAKTAREAEITTVEQIVGMKEKKSTLGSNLKRLFKRKPSPFL